MCLMCDGMTFEDSVRHLTSIVRRHGWAVQMVGPPPGRVGWAYTIGLDHSYGHPELVVLDEDVHRGGELLNVLGRSIRDGEVYGARSEIHVRDHHAELIAVHPVHTRGELLAQWHHIERVDGDQRPAPRALQLIVPELIAESGRREMRTRLDVPFARLPR